MLLLITGCVNVADSTPYVTVRNKNERLNQYLETIKWALEESPFNKIVFCENSGCTFDFNGFVATLSHNLKNVKHFEYLSFVGNREECDKKGKGYGEGEIVLYAVKHSQYILKEGYFYKITGKLQIANIYKVVSDDKCSRFMKYCDKIGKVDTKFYKLMLSDYYRGIDSAYGNVDDKNGDFLEKVYYETLKNSGIIYKPFRVLPVIKGVSGTTGREYNHMSKRKEKLYNAIIRAGLYNCKWMAYLDYILNKIHF